MWVNLNHGTQLHTSQLMLVYKEADLSFNAMCYALTLFAEFTLIGRPINSSIGYNYFLSFSYDILVVIEIFGIFYFPYGVY